LNGLMMAITIFIGHTPVFGFLGFSGWPSRNPVFDTRRCCRRRLPGGRQSRGVPACGGSGACARAERCARDRGRRCRRRRLGAMPSTHSGGRMLLKNKAQRTNLPQSQISHPPRLPPRVPSGAARLATRYIDPNHRNARSFSVHAASSTRRGRGRARHGSSRTGPLPPQRRGAKPRPTDRAGC
jgi:hypothetical protein